MATLNCHRLIMGKMNIGIYCYFIADILTKVFLEMFVEWSSTKHILFVQPLNLIGFHGNQSLNLRKILKNQLLRSYKGDEAKTLQKCSKH